MMKKSEILKEQRLPKWTESGTAVRDIEDNAAGIMIMLISIVEMLEEVLDALQRKP